MSRNFIYIIGLFIAVTVGVYVAKWWYNDNHVTKQDATILLEQVRAVSKLVTTEGYFSEILSETDTKLFYGFPSTKKALLKVKAKVSAGYDLSNMVIDADQSRKTLHLSHIPTPDIISIEPDISYYDVNNGVFNTFSAADYTRLNKKATDLIREQALKSGFMDTVKNQGLKNFDALKILAESMGWKVVFEGDGFKQ